MSIADRRAKVGDEVFDIQMGATKVVAVEPDGSVVCDNGIRYSPEGRAGGSRSRLRLYWTNPIVYVPKYEERDIFVGMADIVEANMNMIKKAINRL